MHLHQAMGVYTALLDCTGKSAGLQLLLFTPYRGRECNLRSPMLNSLREWGERRSTRVFALKIAQKRLEFEGVCTVTCNHQGRMELQACAACEKKLFRESFPAIGMRQTGFRQSECVRPVSGGSGCG